MCGIVAYVGRRIAQPLLIEGLKRLEYRGYDSAGIAVIDDRGETAHPPSRRPDQRSGKLADRCATRFPPPTSAWPTLDWATHGAPTEINAHPHTDNTGKIALVHNGIIENYAALKSSSPKRATPSPSQTDTEVLAVLIGDIYADLKARNHSRRRLLADRRGPFRPPCMKSKAPTASPSICKDEPDTLVVARKGSAADHRRRQERIRRRLRRIRHRRAHHAGHLPERQRDGRAQARSFPHHHDRRHRDQPGLFSSLKTSSKNTSWANYEHYMLKEIFEQPAALRQLPQRPAEQREGRIVLGGIARPRAQPGPRPSLHPHRPGHRLACRPGRRLSDGRPRQGPHRSRPTPASSAIAIRSIDGDTMRRRHQPVRRNRRHARRPARGQGQGRTRRSASCNVVGSTIARETDGGIYLHAGPEIGVASTKAFTYQCRRADHARRCIIGRRALHEPGAMARNSSTACAPSPTRWQSVLDQSDSIARDRRANSASARTGSSSAGSITIRRPGRRLKLKEISYIHAEGYPAAEMKHGPIALINEGMPVVFLATRGVQYDKVISNIEEVKARGGRSSPSPPRATSRSAGTATTSFTSPTPPSRCSRC